MQDEAKTAEQLRRLQIVQRIGIELASERNRQKLLEHILLEAKNLCHAEGGTLYLREGEEQSDCLRFAMARNDVLGLAFGGTTGGVSSLPAVPLREVDGTPNYRNVASYVALHKRSIRVADAYSEEDEFDFSGVRRFDEANHYRSVSFLAIPLLGSRQQVIGVLQLINARDARTGQVREFSQDDQDIVEALAAQAGVTLDNLLLLDGQKRLLESFIKLIAEAIDAKSPYTGGHCERVPILTEMLTAAACEATTGLTADFRLTDEEWYELRIAAWLHDCGKVVTPVHVMDKATKLEAIFDRIELVRERFAVLRREAELDFLRAQSAGQDVSREALDAELKRFDEDLIFLERTNVGGEFLGDAEKQRVREIAARPYPSSTGPKTLLTGEEAHHLCISRGTLTDEERRTINGHMVQTIQMLEALPFPPQLRRVPEYAGGHHEKMDGSGYPKGIFAGDMSIPARVMVIADVFEALTAQDRPYKPGKKLSQAMGIMGAMKADNHLDPDLFDLFITSGVYRSYAARFLPAELIDDVDEARLLAISPKPFDLPPLEARRVRLKSLLPEYEKLSHSKADS